MTITEAVWEFDSFGSLNFHHEGVHAFIQQRPRYCDRGHFSFNVDGIPYIDGADSFPRYYMDIETAMLEATKWLNWRLYKVDAPVKVSMGMTSDFGKGFSQS